MAERPTETNPAGLPMKRTTIFLPEETWNRLRQIAKKENKPLSVTVREAVDSYITRYYLHD